MNDKFEDLVHQYHDKYRTTGIALAISLATLASAECWFFYSLYLKFNGQEPNFQCLTWIVVVASALAIFLISFALQFLHYYGMKDMAQSFFYAYKYEIAKGNSSLKNTREEKWDKALCSFRIADCSICSLKWIVLVNFISVFLYIVIYKPPLPKRWKFLTRGCWRTRFPRRKAPALAGTQIQYGGHGEKEQ